MRFLIKLAVIFLTGNLAHCGPRLGQEPDLDLNSAEGWVHVGYLEHHRLTEASGLAPSRLTNEILWVINDSGNAPRLYAIHIRGQALGVVRLANADNHDWEDLASFRWRQSSYLLIADVGDNARQRRRSTLYIIKEPQIDLTSANPKPMTALPEWIIRFQYPDGPKDCEAVAVDTAAQKIVLLSKRTKPPRLYELPLRPADNTGILTARRLGHLAPLPSPSTKNQIDFGWQRLFMAQPTALDIRATNDVAALLTYAGLYLFYRANDANWQATFARTPRLLRLPSLQQAEAACFSHDGRSIFITSEKKPAPLLRFDIPSHFH
ncbi:MAG: hypothetical protein QNI95_10805 [Desulfobacterales bacterium]|nr:hypothetical protein [Desulfobacterales bacterium]